VCFGQHIMCALCLPLVVVVCTLLAQPMKSMYPTSVVCQHKSVSRQCEVAACCKVNRMCSVLCSSSTYRGQT